MFNGLIEPIEFLTKPLQGLLSSIGSGAVGYYASSGLQYYLPEPFFCILQL